MGKKHHNEPSYYVPAAGHAIGHGLGTLLSIDNKILGAPGKVRGGVGNALGGAVLAGLKGVPAAIPHRSSLPYGPGLAGVGSGVSAPKPRAPKPKSPNPAVQGPMLGGRDRGAKPTAPAKSKGSRPGGTKVSRPAAPAGVLGGKGGRSGGVLAGAGASGASKGGKVAPKTNVSKSAAAAPPAAPKQDSIEDIVNRMVAANIAANQQQTTAYQGTNKGIRDDLTTQTQTAAGAWQTPTGTQVGTGNAEAANAVGLVNGVGSAQNNALKDFIASSSTNTLGRLASNSDVAGAAGVAYGQAQNASKPTLIAALQAQQDAADAKNFDHQLRLQQTALAAQELGDKETAQSAQHQLDLLRLNQTGAYQNGQLALGAAKITAGQQAAAVKASAAADKASAAARKSNLEVRKGLSALERQLFPTTNTGTKIKRDGSGKSIGSQKVFQQGSPTHPLRDSIDAIVQRFDLPPDQAAAIAVQWAKKYTPKASFAKGHEYGTWVAMRNRGVSDATARRLVMQAYGLHSFDPVVARKLLVTVRNGVATAGSVL